MDDLFLQLFMRDGLTGGTGSNELNEQRRDAEKTGHELNESDPPRRPLCLSAVFSLKAGFWLPTFFFYWLL